MLIVSGYALCLTLCYVWKILGTAADHVRRDAVSELGRACRAKWLAC